MKRKGDSEGGTVAVCFHEGYVDVARIERNGGARPVLQLCATLPRGSNDADTLARLGREMRLSRVPCVTLMPHGDYQLQVMEAPDVPEAELKAAVRWRLTDVLDYPPDAATVDVIPVPAEPSTLARGRSVYAVAARSELIAERMTVFSAARLCLRAIDIPEMAQRNVAALFEVPDRALAMLTLTAERGLLTFTAGAELYLARSIDVGLSQLQRAQGDLRSQLLERVLLEVQRSLDHFDRQFSYLSVSKLMLAPLRDDAGLQTRLREGLYIEVEKVSLENHLDLSRVPEFASQSMQAEQLLTIGAALRNEISQ